MVNSLTSGSGNCGRATIDNRLSVATQNSGMSLDSVEAERLASHAFMDELASLSFMIF
jgi:hypothetical protein